MVNKCKCCGSIIKQKEDELHPIVELFGILLVAGMCITIPVLCYIYIN